MSNRIPLAGFVRQSLATCVLGLASCGGSEVPPPSVPSSVTTSANTGEALLVEWPAASGEASKRANETIRGLLHLEDSKARVEIVDIAKGSFTKPGGKQLAQIVHVEGDGSSGGYALAILDGDNGPLVLKDDSVWSRIAAVKDLDLDGIDELILVQKIPADMYGIESHRAVVASIRGAEVAARFDLGTVSEDHCKASGGDHYVRGARIVHGSLQVGNLPKMASEPVRKNCPAPK